MSDNGQADTEEKTPLPLTIYTQRIPIMGPEYMEYLRAAMEAHETDACVRDPKVPGGWVYIRQRALLNMDAMKDKAEKDAPTIVGPDGAPVSGADGGGANG